MHATIQKPIEEIVRYIRPGEKIFVVGCNNCAWKCHSGGQDETKAMAERLARRGIDVVGYTVPGLFYRHPRTPRQWPGSGWSCQIGRAHV